MNTQQLQLAIQMAVQQAMQSGEIAPAAIIAVLECAKLDLHAHLLEAMRKQAATIVPANRMPQNGGET